MKSFNKQIITLSTLLVSLENTEDGLQFINLKIFIKEREDGKATGIPVSGFEEMIYRVIIESIRKNHDISESEIQKIISEHLEKWLKNNMDRE